MGIRTFQRIGQLWMLSKCLREGVSLFFWIVWTRWIGWKEQCSKPRNPSRWIYGANETEEKQGWTYNLSKAKLTQVTTITLTAQSSLVQVFSRYVLASFLLEQQDSHVTPSFMLLHQSTLRTFQIPQHPRVSMKPRTTVLSLLALKKKANVADLFCHSYFLRKALGM